MTNFTLTKYHRKIYEEILQTRLLRRTKNPVAARVDSSRINLPLLRSPREKVCDFFSYGTFKEAYEIWTSIFAHLRNLLAQTVWTYACLEIRCFGL